ncbi:TPM domain-containing protein [Thioclava sp. FR2]|uniref:TPM domain-containing protein n=1 Tax=Thioclava sp. FR2 TaxID=3445780 RepID=UPI003EB6A600
MLRVFLFAVFLPFAAWAQGLPDPISDRVNDFADLLPPEVEQRISQAIQAQRDETGVHVVVVTMERTADYGGVGEPIADYAKRLFNQWGVGDSSRNDGILVLVARTDREMRIALGSAYPVIWDNAAQRVIDRYMLPEFREDRYAEGIEAGVSAVYELIAHPFVAGQPVPEETLETEDWGLIGMILLFFGAVSGLAMKERLGDLLAGLKSCPNCGRRGMVRSREVLEAPGMDSAGRGMLRTHCPSCGLDKTETYRISPTRDRDRSSSGFGGGSSSGGGASGKW